jgi:hypothetical protein
MKANADKTRGPIMAVRNWMEKMILNEKPDCIFFITLSFSRTDVATCLSNATARSPLLDLHCEGYLQSNSAIALPRLHNWIPHAMWNPAGGRLSRCAAFNLFCEANEIYEYWNSGSTTPYGSQALGAPSPMNFNNFNTILRLLILRISAC